MERSKETVGAMIKITWLYALVVLAGVVVAFAPLPTARHPRPSTRLIRVEAGQYAYSPSIIEVNPGDTVILQLVSTDVVHGLYVDSYGVSVQADPGQTRTLTFVANRPGSFRIRCNVTCGAMHPFMIGKLNVGQYTTWLRSVGLMLIGVVAIMLFPKTKAPEASGT